MNLLSSIKFGICNEIFAGWEIERILEYAAGIGYDVLEIAPFTLGQTVTDISKQRRAEIRDAALRVGMEISGLHWVLAKTEGLHINSARAEVRDRTSHYLCELVQCCADLGGSRIILGSPKQRMVEEGVTYEAAWSLAKEVLTPAARRAEDAGVVICIEPLGPAETNFINTAAEARRFAYEMGGSSVSVILDVKAMSAEGKPLPEIIRESKGFFDYFHANDPNLKGPGFGEMDYRPIAEALKDAGYSGTISVEVFDFTEGPETIATESLRYLKSVFGSAA